MMLGCFFFSHVFHSYFLNIKFAFFFNILFLNKIFHDVGSQLTLLRVLYEVKKERLKWRL
jgi:hypothetical protein